MLSLKSLASATAFFLLPVFASPLPSKSFPWMIAWSGSRYGYMGYWYWLATESNALASTEIRVVLCEVEPGRFLKRSENEGPCISQEKALYGVLEHVEYAWVRLKLRWGWKWKWFDFELFILFRHYSSLIWDINIDARLNNEKHVL